MRPGALALAFAVLAGLAGEAARPRLEASARLTARKPATVKVTIAGMQFSPGDAVAHPGDTIVWTNTDVVAHTVTSKTGLFDSKLIPPGGTWKYVAKKIGTFDYKCSYHLPMAGVLTVRQ